MDTAIFAIVMVAIALVVAGLGFAAYKVSKRRGKQKIKVMPVALDPTRSPDLEAGSALKLQPLDVPVGQSESSKVSVMPFVGSPEQSPLPKLRKGGEKALKEQQEELATRLED